MAESSVARMLLHAAYADARALDALITLPDIADGIVGFHAQQAVEKALKSVLAGHGVAFRRTHDLAELLDLLSTTTSPFRPIPRNSTSSIRLPWRPATG